jgi:hypothetical protein
MESQQFSLMQVEQRASEVSLAMSGFLALSLPLPKLQYSVQEAVCDLASNLTLEQLLV